MIISEFYDDEQTITYGNDSAILTKNIIDLGVNTSDIDKAYLMGYVDPDYVPQITHLSKINVVSGGGADYVEFVDVTKKENIPWMYTSGANTNGSSITASKRKKVCYHLNDTDGWVFVDSANSFMKFINSLKVSNASQRIINVCFIAYTIDTVETTKDNYWTGGNTELSFTNSQEFIDWLHGDITKTVTLQLSLTNPSNYKVDFELTGNNFESGEYEIDTDYDGATGRFKTFIYINGIYFTSQRGIGQNEVLGQYPETAVTYHLKSDDGYDWLYRVDGLVGARFASVTSGDPYFLQYTVANLLDDSYVSPQGFNVNGNRYIFGGMTGKIPYRWLVETRPGQVIKHERTLFRKYMYSPTPANNAIRIHMFFLKSDIERMVQQWIRIQLAGSVKYGFNDDMGAPKYNNDNSPAWDILVGDLETIRSQLQPWQIDDIKYNPFTIDDVPPYIPPGPTPPEDEESGDRIPNNGRYFSGAYNFITQYAMTRQQLGQFGNLLWTSWADGQGTITDMWKNFKMFISADPASDTGSIDIASVMDFILSLQVFPFDLSSLLHTDSSNVCIGTGQYPLAVSGKKLLTINHILDCGTMAIPRPYSDFRDYENMTITAYLPYCGSVELNPGDVVGRSVGIEYSVDTLSGSCTAVLTVYDDEGYLYNVGMINGQISASIPMTATNSGQIRAHRISDVASLAGLAGNTFLGNITQGSSISPSGVDSNPIGAISSLATGTVGRSFNSAISAQQMFANRFSRGAISCPTLAGGNGIAAFYQPACPYIQMRYGLYQKPANYDHSVGGVSASSNPLSSYAGSGFTVCENVDISGFTCHEEERSAIKALLESGVYL